MTALLKQYKKAEAERTQLVRNVMLYDDALSDILNEFPVELSADEQNICDMIKSLKQRMLKENAQYIPALRD